MSDCSDDGNTSFVGEANEPNEDDRRWDGDEEDGALSIPSLPSLYKEGSCVKEILPAEASLG